MPGSCPRPLPPALTDAPFAVSAALALGVPPSRLLAADLARPFHGVRSTRAPETLVDRCRALATRLRPDQFFSHATAALLWGLPVPRRLESGSLHVTTPGRQRSCRSAGVVGHRTQRRARVVRCGGMPVTDPVRTWLDLAPLLSRDELVVVGDAVVSTRRDGGALASVDDLSRAVESSRAPGLPRLRAALPLVRTGSASPGETWLRLVMVRGGVAEPALNVRVVTPSGRYLGRGDFVFAGARVVVEYEGDGHRVDRDQWRHDLRRRERFEDAGWRVVRATADDAGPHAREFVGRLRRLVAVRTPVATGGVRE